MLAACKVGVIGYGSIGRVVAERLSHGDLPEAVISCVVRRGGVGSTVADVVTIEEAIERCDLIVEAASHRAVRDYGRRILESGVDLVVVSIGALTDPAVAESILARAPGRVYFTTGAIGGLDLLAAARRMGPFESVTLTTTKQPRVLIQDWMDSTTRAALECADEPVEVYRGNAADVTALFPKSANVAGAVALAVETWRDVRVVMVADPSVSLTKHVVEAVGCSGNYRFAIQNSPTADNPATSGVVPFAVIQALARILGSSGQIM